MSLSSTDAESDKMREGDNASAAEANINADERAREARAKSRILTQADMIVYRALSDAEKAKVNAASAKSDKKA